MNKFSQLAQMYRQTHNLLSNSYQRLLCAVNTFGTKLHICYIPFPYISDARPTIPVPANILARLTVGNMVSMNSDMILSNFLCLTKFSKYYLLIRREFPTLKIIAHIISLYIDCWLNQTTSIGVAKQLTLVPGPCFIFLSLQHRQHQNLTLFDTVLNHIFINSILTLKTTRPQ